KQWRLLSITLPKMMPSVGSITVVYLPENCCKLTMEGKAMSYPDRYDQENLLNFHKAKMHLEMAIALLTQ
ncbi:MAG: hypothetical protein V7K97_07130, partial [Nostoc sp.]